MICITKKQASELAKYNPITLHDLSGNEFLLLNGEILQVQYISDDKENNTDTS